jgi:hypothetical protein
MKKTLTLLLICLSTSCFAQQQLISYEDLKFLLRNNLQQADTFLASKNYSIAKQSNNAKNRKYNILLKDKNHISLNIRLDGRRMFIEIETNDIGQYDLIRQSISPFLNKETASITDVQTYNVKDLGSIYITVNDTQPYSPIRKDYTINVVSEKNITVYN